MKPCLFTALLVTLFLLQTVFCHGQKVNTKTYNRFLTEYHTNNEAISKTAVLRHDTMVHPLAVASTYLIQEKVYPNDDAVRLVQELNPKIDMTGDASAIPGDTRLILPNYPPAKEDVIVKFNAEYLTDASPDGNLNQVFKNLSDAFNQIFQRLTVPEDEAGKKYYDSLAFFNSRILPYINNSAQSISRLQMVYFNKELSALNESFSMRRLPAGAYRRGGGNSHETASYILRDFYEIANPVQIRKRSIYTERVTRGGSSTWNKKDFELTFFDNLNAKPFACNLYIYGKDDSGKRKQDPEMELYEVWVGDKMSFNTSVTGSAPESYGFLKMGNPASTLPFNIGLGKWIVVMKKKGPGGVYLFKEISIFSETEMEPDNPNARKVCYVLD